MISLKISPYRSFLADEQFVLWVENVERGSVIMTAEYFRRIMSPGIKISNAPMYWSLVYT